MPHFQNAFATLAETLLGLYLVAVILRFWFHTLRLDFRNPCVRAVGNITRPPLAFLWKFIPACYGVDLAALVLIIALGMAKLSLELWLGGYPFTWSGAVVVSLARALDTMVWIFIAAILGRVILSWVAPRSDHPAAKIVYGLSAPLMNPFQRVLPTFGGLDFSPILALLSLRLGQQILLSPLSAWGAQLLFA